MDEMNRSNFGIIILAAGSSKRLGKPKQLVKFQNNTLISRAVELAISTNIQNINIVLGANSSLISEEIKDFPIKICINEKWQDGMSSSIQCGLQNLLDKTPTISAILVMLCDQPLITVEHLNSIINKFTVSDKPIVTSRYNNINGVPAIFSSEIFDDLLKIEGDKGARNLIERFTDLVETIDIPDAEFDIDTPEDLHQLNTLK